MRHGLEIGRGRHGGPPVRIIAPPVAERQLAVDPERQPVVDIGKRELIVARTVDTGERGSPSATVSCKSAA